MTPWDQSFRIIANSNIYTPMYVCISVNRTEMLMNSRNFYDNLWKGNEFDNDI